MICCGNELFIKLLAAIALAALLNGPLLAVPSEIPDEIIIKYRSPSRLADHGALTRRLGRHWEVVKVDGADGEAVTARQHRLWQRIAQICADSNVQYAEPNYRGHFEEGIQPSPNDTSYPSQWWLPAVGDREMWALGRGAGVIVAVIDTGVDLMHPDLASSLLPDGYNFGDGNSNPQDILGHGTKVAGIVGATQNNGVGVSGLAPDAKILPIKINPGGQNTFSSDQLASAIAYATAHGAKIINLSLTVDQQTQTVQEAIQSALDKGVIVVAAAGNNGGAVEFPATMPGVFAVAATDQSNHLASLSNSGPEILVAAPGINVLSTALGGGVAASVPGGTSFSAPVVSATIADMLSINPTLPADVIARQLRENASTIGDGKSAFGIVNAGRVGNSLVPHLQLSSQVVTVGDTISVNYLLPPTASEVDFFVAVATPIGVFSLCPDGNWIPFVPGEIRAVASGFTSSKGVSGALFGSTALFPPIGLRELPLGAYTWAIAMQVASTGKIAGGIITSPMQLRPETLTGR